MKIPWLQTKIRRPADDGSGKRFVFSTSGESSFTNFSASEVISILTAMRGEDAMSARFGEGR